MKIVIYIESLRTFTSGTPHRGVLLKLIELRSEDEFVLVLRKGDLPKHMQELFENLKRFSNWSLMYEKRSRRYVNTLALLHFKNHCEIDVEGDVYLSFDADFLGTGNHPQIITVLDLSSVRNSNSSSISFMKRLARKFTIENATKNSDYIVAISEFTRNDILDYFAINETKITTIHNGIYSKWFEENISTFGANKEKYWIWWGAYSQRKNLERLLKAYDMMLKDAKNEEDVPSLYLIGNKNDYFSRLLSIINESDFLIRKVKIYPQQEIDSLKALVSGSSGLVFPSLYEGFGLPVIEAYSQGVPVLTSNVSSLPEISGGLGVLVDPLDIVSIKNGLIDMHNKKYDSNALRNYATKYSYKAAALQYSKVIDKCKK